MAAGMAVAAGSEVAPGYGIAARPMFLVSSFRRGVAANSPVLESWISAVLARAGNAVPRLTYVPTAMYALQRDSSRSPGQQRQQARRDAKQRRDEACAQLGQCEALTLDLYDGSIKHGDWASDPLQAIVEADCLLIEGGNTFWLRKCLERYRDAFLSSKAVYVGVSAGAIIAGSSVATALWKGWDDPEVAPEWTTASGLHLVHFAIFPHYSREWRSVVDDRKSQFGDDTFVIDEHGAIVVLEDGTATYYLAESAWDIEVEELDCDKSDEGSNCNGWSDESVPG